MEIINKNKVGSDASKGVAKSKTYVILGAILIALGIVWLLFNYDVLSEAFFDYLFSWQSLVTIIGIVLLSTRNWVSGVVTTVTGVFFLVMDIFGVCVSFTKIVLPVLVIALGVVCLFVKRDEKEK
ncbi:MAG: hypothetical protein SOZ00_00750 [Tidjanibacter sp.]|nr:hypothetical protein [Tidjanibacter sp.]